MFHREKCLEIETVFFRNGLPKNLKEISWKYLL